MQREINNYKNNYEAIELDRSMSLLYLCNLSLNMYKKSNFF